MKTPIAFLAACIAATSAHGASVSVSFDFNALSSGDSATARLAPSSAAVANLTATPISKSGYDDPIIANTSSSSPQNSFLLSTTEGNTGGLLAPYFPQTTAANDSEAEVAALGHYFQFTLTPAAGYVLDLSTLTFDYSASGNTNGRTFFVRYDHHTGTANDFSSANLVSGAIAPPPTSSTPWSSIGTAGNLDGIALVNGDAGESVTLRFYGYRTTNSGTAQNIRYDNITVSGDLSAVPEPSAALLGALSALCLLRRKR